MVSEEPFSHQGTQSFLLLTLVSFGTVRNPSIKKCLSTIIRITSLHILTAIDHTAHGMRYKMIMIYIALIACVTEKITVLCMTMYNVSLCLDVPICKTSFLLHFLRTAGNTCMQNIENSIQHSTASLKQTFIMYSPTNC